MCMRIPSAYTRRALAQDRLEVPTTQEERDPGILVAPIPEPASPAHAEPGRAMEPAHRTWP